MLAAICFSVGLVLLPPAPARSLPRAQSVLVRMDEGAPTPIDSPPPPSPPASPPAPGGALVLPSSVKDILRDYDLKDPSTFSQVELDKYLAGAGAGALTLFLLPIFGGGLLGDLALSAIIGGGGLAYAQLRKDDIGDVTTKIGGYSLQAIEKGQDLNEKYEVSDKFKAKADELVKDLERELKKKL